MLKISSTRKLSIRMIILTAILAFFLVGALSGIASAATAGPNNPGSDVTMATGNPAGSTTTWTTTGNTGSNDGTPSEARNVKAESTSYLKITNFGFTLTNCASIDGITVEIQRWCESGANCTDNSVRLVNGSDAIVGTDHSVGGAWSSTEPAGYQSYGGSADTWSAGLGCSDINGNTNFGVVVSVSQSVNTNYNAMIDHVRVTVDYTQGANNPPSLNIDQPAGGDDEIALNGSFDIQYDLSDAEDAATVTFYYETDGNGAGGTMLPAACQNRPEGTNLTCTWNTSGVSANAYYVYGVADDGVNTPVTVVSSGTLIINDSPSLTIDQPAGGDDEIALNGSFNVQYDLSDTDDVTTVTFYYETDGNGSGGTMLPAACQNRPEGTNLTCTWNTSGVPANAYYVYGVADDGVNAPVTVVSSGTLIINDPPSLTIDQPAGGDDSVTQGQTFNVQYDLSDTDDVVMVTFYYETDGNGAGGTMLPVACQNRPEGTNLTCGWDTTGVTPDSYYVYGVADDGVNAAVTTVSSNVLVITAPNNPPSLTINQPAGGDDSVTEGGTFDVNYDLSDTEDAASVTFYYETDGDGAGGTMLPAACQNQPEGAGATCTWDTTGVMPDSYYVYGVADDGVNSPVTVVSSGVLDIISQRLSAWLDESSNTAMPGATDIRMAKITTTAVNGGSILTQTQVQVDSPGAGGLANNELDAITVYWNTLDDFGTATSVGSQANPNVGTPYDITLTGAGSATGYLFYTIDISGAEENDTYALTVNSVTGSTSDVITLPQTTAQRIIGSTNNPPDTPTSGDTDQYKNDGATTIAATGTTDEALVKIIHMTNDPDTDDVQLQVEMVDYNGGLPTFTGTPNCQSGFVTSGSDAVAICNLPLLDGTQYVWKARTYDGTDYSNWYDPSGTYDFDVVLSANFYMTSCTGCHGLPPADGTRNSATGAVVGAHGVTFHVPASAVPADCNNCHVDDTPSDNEYNHRDGNIEMAATIFGATGSAYSEGTSFPQTNSPTLGNCTATYCHGGTSFTWAVPTLTTYNHCTICHGIQTVGADTTDGVGTVLMAPGGNDGSGVDTEGHTGTESSNVSDDPQVGAHRTHLMTLNNFSDDISCDECHVVPTSPSSAGHWDTSGARDFATITFGNLADGGDDGQGAAAPSYDDATGVCNNTYCHDGSYFKNGWSSSGADPDWNDGTYLTGTFPADCNTCHQSPPTAVAGHPTSDTDLTTCKGCHNHVNASGTGFDTVSLHMNGTVEGAGDCWSCHGNKVDKAYPPDAYWGTTKSTADGVGAHVWHIESTGTIFTKEGPGTLEEDWCNECHDVPAAVGDAGHQDASYPGDIFTAGAAPIEAEYGGVTATFTPEADNDPDTGVGGACNVYCHGVTLAGGNNTTPDWGDSLAGGCVACHGNPPSTAVMPDDHVVAGTCTDCHSHAGTGADHIDGSVTYPNATCFSCHGSTASDYAPDSSPSATYPDRDNSHSAHMDQTVEGGVPFSSTTCTTATCHPDNSGNFAHSNGTTTQSCDATVCHNTGTATDPGSNPSPTWGTGTADCGWCHENPPSSTASVAGDHTGVPGTTGCSITCHPHEGTGSPATHINGAINYNTLTCTTCHGQPPSGASAPNREGSHAEHTGTTMTSVIGTGQASCGAGASELAECHPTLPGASEWNHANNVTLVSDPTECNTCHNSSVITAAAKTALVSVNSTNWYTNPGVPDCTWCHDDPPTGSALFDHAGVSSGSCAGCHPHEGTGSPAEHMDGTVTATASCYGCHTTFTGGTASQNAQLGVFPGEFNPSVASYGVHRIEDSTETRTAQYTVTPKSTVISGGADVFVTNSFIGAVSKDTVLACTDCHDINNGGTGHMGAIDRDLTDMGYMLRARETTITQSGQGASLGNPTYATGGVNDNMCVNCHRLDVYDIGGDNTGLSAFTHVKNSNDDDPNMSGISCQNCHGSGRWDDCGASGRQDCDTTNYNFGAHGNTGKDSSNSTVFTLGPNASTGFMNGASWRQTWDGTNCYTGSNTDAKWNSCSRGDHK